MKVASAPKKHFYRIIPLALLLASLALSLYFDFRDYTNERNTLFLQTKNLSYKVESKFLEHYKQIQGLSFSKEDLEKTELLNPTLSEFQQKNPTFEMLYLFDAQGNLKATTQLGPSGQTLQQRFFKADWSTYSELSRAIKGSETVDYKRKLYGAFVGDFHESVPMYEFFDLKVLGNYLAKPLVDEYGQEFGRVVAFVGASWIGKELIPYLDRFHFLMDMNYDIGVYREGLEPLWSTSGQALNVKNLTESVKKQSFMTSLKQVYRGDFEDAFFVSSISASEILGPKKLQLVFRLNRWQWLYRHFQSTVYLFLLWASFLSLYLMLRGRNFKGQNKLVRFLYEENLNLKSSIDYLMMKSSSESPQEDRVKELEQRLNNIKKNFQENFKEIFTHHKKIQTEIGENQMLGQLDRLHYRNLKNVTKASKLGRELDDQFLEIQKLSGLLCKIQHQEAGAQVSELEEQLWQLLKSLRGQFGRVYDDYTDLVRGYSGMTPELKKINQSRLEIKRLTAEILRLENLLEGLIEDHQELTDPKTLRQSQVI